MVVPHLTFFEHSLPPSTNRIWRASGSRGRKVQMHVSKQARDWKSRFAWAAKAARAHLHEGPIAVTLIMHPRKTRNGRATQRRLDLDNVAKLALDALNGVCYNDDHQVRRILLEIGDPRDHGMLSVEVEPYAGAQQPSAKEKDGPRKAR